MSGTVVEIGGGLVPGAKVSAKSCDGTPAYNYVFSQTETDLTGAFRLTFDSGSQLPVGCVYLNAEKSGYVRPPEENPTWNGGSADSSRENIELKLQRLRRITGRIVGVEDDAPLGDVEVRHAWSGVAVLSNANGDFNVTDIGNSLTMVKSGFVSRSVTVSPGQDLDLGLIRLQREIKLTAGERVVRQISPRDVYYDDYYVMWDDGVFCSPCKAFTVDTRQQDLEVSLEWSGEIPLAVWGVAGGYEEFRSRSGPGASRLAIRLPAGTVQLLVGVPASSPGQHTVAQPIAFELRSSVLAR